MPGPTTSLPRIHDNLNLVKRFIDRVPVKGRDMLAFKKAAAAALEEAIIILTPTGLELPCRTKVLPKTFEPFYYLTPCRTKVMERMMMGELVVLSRPVCTSTVMQKDVKAAMTHLTTRAARPKK